MTRRVLAAVVVVLLVGGAAPGGFVGQAAAGSTTIEFQEALDNEERTSQVTAEFTLSENGTVTAEGQVSDGGVTFNFQSWNDLDGGASGGSTEWTGQAGHTYRVTYEAVAQRSAASQGGAYYELAPSEYLASGPAGSYNENLAATVYLRSPQFGSIGDRSQEVVFESTGSQSTSVSASIPNDGQGVMVPDSVSFSGTPSGISASASGLPNEIGAGRSGSFDVDVTVDDDVSEGTHTFEATVEDNLGHTESFHVTVDVVKAPKVDVGNLDLGDVLVGTSTEYEFTVSEDLGFDGIDGVTATGAGGGQYGDLSFSGLQYVDTDAGGSDTADVTLDVDEDAAQHATLQWRVTFRPDDQHGIADTSTVSARVIYPAEFGQASFGDTEFVFDEPRSSGGQTTETTVTVPNVGDVNFDSVSASASADGISAQVVDAPSSLPGQEERELTLELSADSDVSEGTYPVEVDLSGDSSSGSDSRTYTTDVTVEHVPQLDVGASSLDFGEVRVTQSVTESTDVSEVLGYESVSGLTVEKVSGPDQWLEVTSAPEGSLSAGEAAPFEVALAFDTSAEVFQEYTWEFDVGGEGVETETITVTGTPKPVNFDSIRSPLADRAGGSGWQADTAGGMVTVLDGLEEKLRGDSEVAASDLSIATAAGHSTTVFIDSASQAQEHLDAGNHSAAQADLVRAVAAYNVLDVYTGRLEDPDLRGPARSTVETAGGQVSELVAAQTDHLEGRLEGDDVTVLEQARINRQLARLEGLRGNDDRAATLRERSQSAFDEYVSLVDEASATRQDARGQWTEMREDTLAVVFGRPLMVNPAKFDAFNGQSDELLATYDEAAATFDEAGAGAEASSVRETRSERATQLQFARYSLYGATAFYALVFLGVVVRLGRGGYAYVRDAEEATQGDFLLAG